MKLHCQFEDSSMLSDCSYDTETEELTVTFMNGKAYTYIDVNERLYHELIGAKSAGRYFNLMKQSLKQKHVSA